MRVSFPLAQIPRTESAITNRGEAKIYNGYVYDDGGFKCVTKRPGRVASARMSSGEIIFHPFHDSQGNVWWLDNSLRIWKNDHVPFVESTDWVDFGTAAEDSSIGTVGWNNVSYILRADDGGGFNQAADVDYTNHGYFLGPNEESYYLKATDPADTADGLPVNVGIDDIPVGATIEGVQIRVAKYSLKSAPSISNILFNSVEVDDAISGSSWSNVNNILVSDGNNATTTVSSSSVLRARRLEFFGLNFSGSTIFPLGPPDDVIMKEFRLREKSSLSGNTPVSSTVFIDGFNQTDNVFQFNGVANTTSLKAFENTITGADVKDPNFFSSLFVDYGSFVDTTTVSVDLLSLHLLTFDFNYEALDNSIRLVKGGVISGDDKAGSVPWSFPVGSVGPGDLTYVIYGGAKDLWGLTLTDSDVKAPNFGVVISAKGPPEGAAAPQLSHVQVKVFYTTSTPPALDNLYIANGVTWAEDEQFIYVHGGGDGSSGHSDYVFRKDLADASALDEITDTDHPLKKAIPDWSPPGVVALDGYFFIIGNYDAANDTENSYSRIYNSDLGDPTAWTATNFIASNKAGKLLYLAKHHRHIVAFGGAGIEFFYNAGNPVGSPLANRLDISHDIGLVASPLDGANDNVHSRVVPYGDQLFFVGRPHRGGIGIYVLDNFQPRRISSPAIDRLLTENSVIRGVLSFNNKDFLIVNASPADSFSLVYDIAENMWYEWSVNYNRGVSGGKIAISGSDTLWDASGVQDAGSNYNFELYLPKFNQLPGIQGDTRGLRKFLRQIGVESDFPGSETLLEVSYSDDDYQTFSTARTLDLNNKFKKIHRWGNFYDRAFKLSYTGSNNFKLYNFVIDVDLERP